MGTKHFLTPEGKFLPLVGKSGDTYIPTNNITIGRWGAYERYSIEGSFGKTPTDLFKSMKKVHELFNAGKVGDAIIENYNNMNVAATVADKKYNAFFYIASLFLNKENEDLSTFDESIATAKIEDWAEYDVNDFFSFAKSIAPDFSEDFKEIFHTSTESAKKRV